MRLLRFLASLWGAGRAPTPVQEVRDTIVSARADRLSPADSDLEPVPAETGAPDIEAELDAALDFMTCPTTGSAPVQTDHPNDTAAPRELFAGIAAHYSRPMKNFIFELRRGATSKEWVEISRPVLSSILSAAETMEIPEVTKCLADLDESLAMAQQDDNRELSGESRELILSIYEELAQILPDAFALGEEDYRRESVIIHSLLRQIPGVGYVTMEKLYEAGLTSLDTLFLATYDEMADTTGVPTALCTRICEKIQEHRYRLDATSPEDLLQGHRGRLAELVAELRHHHDAFKKACEADHPDEDIAEKKRGARCGRQACALKINVVLAEMGEVGLVEEIQKLALEQRMQRLEAHLARTGSPAPFPVALDPHDPPAPPRA